MYANSFLATLNTRLVLKGRGTDDAHETVPTFLMVDTHTIPPPPRHASDELYSPGGKVRIWPHFLSPSIVIVTGLLTYIHFSSRKCRRTPSPHPVSRVIPVDLRLASTRKFGSKRILSVGLQLTAF